MPLCSDSSRPQPCFCSHLAPALRSAWTNKLITAKDHASVQVNIGNLNEEGVYDGTFTTFALTGKVRCMVSHWAFEEPQSSHRISQQRLSLARRQQQLLGARG